VIELIYSGIFSGGYTELFRPLIDHLMKHDEYLLMADYRAYVDCQQEVNYAFLDVDGWTRMSILNVARMASFSSDRSILEYAENIWNLKPLRPVA
jgi:starch phosphorylase